MDHTLSSKILKSSWRVEFAVELGSLCYKQAEPFEKSGENAEKEMDLECGEIQLANSLR